MLSKLNLYNDIFNGTNLFDSFNTDKQYNLIKTANGYKFEFSLPGFNEDDIDLSLEDNVLKLSANSIDEEEFESEYLHKGYSTKSYSQSFRIPNGVDDSSVIANFKNGILTVTLETSKTNKIKKIKIK
jgi:HSP20 family protein